MKLVLVYQQSDGYTYAYEEVVPFEYPSKDQAEFDFIEACEAVGANPPYNFNFAGTNYDSSYFYCEGKYYGPEFYTLEEWFEANKTNQ